MNDLKIPARKNGIELEYEFSEPPQKVWRAVSTPELRENWLPKEALADPEAISVTPGEEVRYRLRDDAPPFLESTVTFRIAPNASGGTSLRIIHELDDARLRRTERTAANNNGLTVMRAA
ncbi:SRPBCC domain-containing protein [Rhizobium sp. NPDC090279]|uniref:SRPBCC family protein n=1 Tax=Rhizobium sp. NPDC090279 TaxID=3364499 RepID=UPI00383A934F